MRIFIVATTAGRDGPGWAWPRRLVILGALRRAAPRTHSKSNDTFIPPCHCHVSPPLSEMAGGSVSVPSSQYWVLSSQSHPRGRWSLLMAADGRSHCRRLRVWIFGICGATCYEFFRGFRPCRAASDGQTIIKAAGTCTVAIPVPEIMSTFCSNDLHAVCGTGFHSNLLGWEWYSVWNWDCPILSATR